MYDTIKLWGDNQGLSDSINISKIAHTLSKVKEVVCQETGELFYFGNIDNLRVRVSQLSLSVEGSICKYFLNDNFQTLTRKDTQLCFERLSDYLHLPMQQCKVTRLDVAQNFIMKYPAAVYYSHLGEARFYKRLEQPSSIYYRNGLRTLLFYDKVAEQKVKGYPVPDLYQSRNGLRYEARFSKRLSHLFNVSLITGTTLYNEDFYSKALGRWKDEYFSIKKNRYLTIDPSFMSTVKDFENFIFLSGLQAIGGEQVLLHQIDLAKKQGVLKNKMQAKRLKDKVKHLCQIPELTSESEAIKELDRKVRESVKYFR